jgi:hypothetical protein
MHGQRAYRSAGGAPRSPAPALWEAGREEPPGLITPDIDLIEWRWADGDAASVWLPRKRGIPGSGDASASG